MKTLPIVGSYQREDCQFLLELVEAKYLSIEEKEKAIQSGTVHYSDVLNKEAAPSEVYQALFYQFVEDYKYKFSKHVMELASTLDKNRRGDITLLSLARAGTPIGVLLKRALEEHYNRKVQHFSVSIIRDRGLDLNALDYLIEELNVNQESIAFIDGWTAKGVITRELYQSINTYNAENNTRIPNELYVISDCGGWADYSATAEDYPIPSSMLNSTVSGLISRSIWQPRESNKFHGCSKYEELSEVDCSNWFVDQISSLFPYVKIKEIGEIFQPTSQQLRSSQQSSMKRFIDDIMCRYGISDVNHIKPGVAEATRVMLRRVPELLIIRSMKSEKVQHLITLAKEKNVNISVETSLLFEACALIKQLKK
ncbi:cysteine protease StiP family protein [Enterovibrio makurazakiensis]|uniref:cysteine protease StiP family protein n=1 Tax=Enterovibrio makurazakiensis TaxID=2910232 RepID=UPI003D1D7CE8